MTAHVPNDSNSPICDQSSQAAKLNSTSIDNLYVKDLSTQSGDNLILESLEKEHILNQENKSIISRVVLFQCDKSKNLRVAIASDSQKYASKLLCTCGNIHRILLDSRHSNRKPVNLNGSYAYQNDDKNFGKLIVEDLSFSGLKFRMTDLKQISRDDLLDIQFILDDKDQTLIREKVRVSYVSHDIVGVEFINLNKINTKLAVYLMH